MLAFTEGPSAGTTPKKNVCPDANSHSNYNLLIEESQNWGSLQSENIILPYSVANSHQNTCEDSNSHNKYRIFHNSSLFLNNDGVFQNNGSYSYSLADSHNVYDLLSESSERNTESLSREGLIPVEENIKYEVANSHGNYQILYNNQTQLEISMNYQDENSKNPSSLEKVPDYKQFRKLANADMPKIISAGPAKSESSQNLKSNEKKKEEHEVEEEEEDEEETSTTCDIEECLIQIEESLLNIEQNLLQVQDLDIPELKKLLLYKSPSIERSLFEVQDLLCNESLESVKCGDLFLARCNTEQEDSDHDTFTNDDNLLRFDKSCNDHLDHSPSDTNSLLRPSGDENINFIPNSLGKSPMRNFNTDTKKNFSCHLSTDVEIVTTNSDIDTISYNLNVNDPFVQKKLSNRKICHSRTNSLDENSIFPSSTLLSEQRKVSLDNLYSETVENNLEINVKAKSENTLQTYKVEVPFDLKTKLSTRKRCFEKDRITKVEMKAQEFCKKMESIISKRQPVLIGYKQQVDKSPKSRHKLLEMIVDKDKNKNEDSETMNYKPYNKRKKKKLMNKRKPTDSALVSSKLISLSLSLLLAALLQAVRCLTDLVEDAFKSISYDRNGYLP